MGDFGAKFRTTREKKGISLDDVSNVTKISARMLQAIEQENFDQLPGGVFNKGFIRAYAKHLGLNDEEAVTDYLACLRQAQIDANANWEPEARPAPPRAAYAKPELKKESPVAEAVRPTEGRQNQIELPDLHLPRAEDVRPPRRNFSEKRSPAVPWTIVAAAALVVILAAIVWIRSHRNLQADSAVAAPPPAAQVVQNQPTVQPTSSAAVSPLNHAASQPAKTAPPANQPTTSPSPGSGSAPHILPPAQAAGTANGGTNPVVATTSTHKAETPESDVTVRTFPANSRGNAGAASAGSPAPAATTTNIKSVTLTLVIRATETSWISVSADGREVSHETLIAPAEASIRASRAIVARVGNAAGVSFLFNGKEIPAQGGESEAKTFVFDGQGMRVAENPPTSPNQ